MAHEGSTDEKKQISLSDVNRNEGQSVEQAETNDAGSQGDQAQGARAEDWHESFVALLTAEQLPLLRYITTLLGDADSASNVLQETNLVLWRKASEFQSGTSFAAWSKKVAYWQTLAFIRNRKRDRHVFSEELVKQIASRPALNNDLDETRMALRHCLTELSAQHLELIKQRYAGNDTIATLASKLGLKQNAVKVRLYRIRQALLNCIQYQMAAK